VIHTEPTPAYLLGMKIFVSSLIGGMEPIRAAARSAVTTLGHDPVMAEDFGALPHTPQIACLDGVRQAGAVVLILGSRYGAIQSSGLSATHEEYREARDRCPVLAFVEQGITPEPKQADFITEVQTWDSGLIRVGFTDVAQLEREIIRSLHRLDLASASAPFDAKELLSRTLAMLPDERSSYGAVLAVSIAGGPAQAILRPSRMEDPALAEMLEKEALFGIVRLFERSEGTQANIDQGALILEQGGRRGNCGRAIRIDPQGGILIRLSINSEGDGLPAILVEIVHEQLAAFVRYAAWVLDQIDPTQRLSHVAIAAQLTGSFGMRTRREHDASPHSMSMGSNYGRDDHSPVHLSPAHLLRPALAQQTDQIVADLMTLLRRQRR
jgi:hypothetical protein